MFILKLPNLEFPFVIEMYASYFEAGAVLLQNSHSISFFSNKLGVHHRRFSVYHREQYAIVEAVQKWGRYFLSREFIVMTDQKSLNELLTQVVQTPDQQFYVCKLI